MAHANGNLSNLVESLDLVNQAHYAARKYKKPTAEQLRQTFDQFNCSFSSLKKLELIRSAMDANLGIEKEGNANFLSLCKLARKHQNLDSAARLLSQCETCAPLSASSFFDYESANLFYSSNVDHRSTTKQQPTGYQHDALIMLLKSVSSRPDDDRYRLRSYLRAAQVIERSERAL